MAKNIGTRTLTIIRKPKADRFDPNPPAETRHEVTGCAIVPRSSFEQDKGWVTISGWAIFAPYGSDITGDDRIEIEGESGIWDVDGKPGNYESARGKPKAMILYVDQVS